MKEIHVVVFNNTIQTCHTQVCEHTDVNIQSNQATKSEVFFHGHKTKKNVFGHTHKKILLKIFNYYFLSISSLLLKKYFFMCMTIHFFFGIMTILEFLPKELLDLCI